ncbi:hypothetical protein [Mycolicibacterium fortuitum]|uniref:hypothetical protein n=1 Tax=Mycolicibacterium fortuitum TaxID=1766 RepID=UPI00096C1131|nr:hypothetical protein [Mycolicibacterium fortuitum]OMC08535.1 hypothetical protein A5734_01750 [Mycolicibacterium fortuitum]
MANFYVDTEKVESVLLADGWHSVVPGSLVLGGLNFLQGQKRLVEREGFQFKQTDGAMLSGPLTSIVAVGWRSESS